MPMATEKNKTKQCPQKEGERDDDVPPGPRTRSRSFFDGQTSRFQAIQNYFSADSIRSGHFFLL